VGNATGAALISDNGRSGPASARTSNPERSAEAGFPAPRVLLAHCEREILDHMFVVMARIPGRAFLRGSDGPVRSRLPAGCYRLAGRPGRLQRRLHELDPSFVLESTSAQGLTLSTVSTRDISSSLNASSKSSAEPAHATAWRGSVPTNPPTRCPVGCPWRSVARQRAAAGSAGDRGRRLERGRSRNPALDVGFAKGVSPSFRIPFRRPHRSVKVFESQASL